MDGAAPVRWQSRGIRAHPTAGKPRIAWEDEAARTELVGALVGDALALLAALDAAHHDEHGDPDGLGDLKRSNQVALRLEIVYGWYVFANRFSVIEDATPPSEG